MTTPYLSQLKKRRSIYHIGTAINMSEEDLETLIQSAIKESPSAFNAQSSRAVILFGQAHKTLWQLVEKNLKPVTPPEAFPNTQAKLASFSAGKGTVLFFEDVDVTKSLQEQFSLYADNFPRWAEQSTGIAQHSVWVALADQQIGATIQHYNPLIDADVQKEWDLPTNWRLTGQMPFGSIETPASKKEYMEDAERFRTFN